jgi:hypothetical protein
MNDQEINRAIAEHLGWRCQSHVPEQNKAGEIMCWIPPGNHEWHPVLIPNYCRDLNAMHKAVQILNEVELFRYADEVCDLAYDGHHDTDIQKLLKLSAKELAWCYVRAIGKWSE